MKSRSSVRTTGGFGREPHRDRGRRCPSSPRCRRSSRGGRSPGWSGSRPPSRATEPSARTTSTASTCADVTPDARQCGPPALVADVAADRARLLRRRIGRVVQAEVARPRGDRSRLSTPGSTHATRSIGVDLEDAVHLGRDDDDRVVERRRAAGEAGAAPPRHERPVVTGRDAHGGRELFGRRGEAHHRRPRRGRRPRRARRARARAAPRGPVGAEHGPEIGEQCAVVVDVRSLPTRCRYAR